MKYLADKADLLEQGKNEGKLEIIFELFDEEDISLEKAAQKSKLTNEEFLEKYEEYKEKK